MKNKNLMIAASGLCLLLTLFFGCGERSGEKEYNKAMASWKNGDLSRAQGQMEKAIRKFSSKERKAVANNQLGIILWNLQKKEEAVEKFSESCRLSEDLTGANINRGIALYHLGRLNQARFEFTKILGGQPRNTMARTFLGLTHIQQKEWKKAMSEFSIGLEANPSDPAGLNALALAQLHLNTSSKSTISHLKQIVATHPDYVPALYNLAVVFDQWLHDGKAATGWYRQYLQKAGANATHADAAQKAIARLGKTPGNAAYALPEKAGSTTAENHITAGSALHAKKKYRDAVVEYEKAIQADPSQATAYYHMGLSLYKLEKYRQTATACKKALQIDPELSDARYMLSLSYTKQGKWKAAEREAKTLKKSDAVQGEYMLKYISSESRK